MRAIGWVSFLGMVVAAGLVGACPSGYESPESLVKRARLILELEVLEVSDQPLNKSLPVRGQPLRSQSPGAGADARAKVQVLSVMKGQTTLESFTLIGGPCVTCAPYPVFHRFTAGQRLHLILDDVPLADTESIEVNWKGRILQDVENTRIAALMENARIAWKRDWGRHQSVSPAEAENAKALYAIMDELPSAEPLATESFGTLAGLITLLRNPDALRPLPPPPPQDSKNGSTPKDPFSNRAPTLPSPPEPGVYRTHTFWPSNGWDLPAAVTSAIKTVAKERPAEVKNYNGKLLGFFLENELFLSKAEAKSLASHPSVVKSALSETEFNPCDMRINRRDDGEKIRLHSLEIASALVSDEPDPMVWKGFGLMDPEFDVSLFEPLLRNRPYLDWSGPGRLTVLLSLPGPAALPAVRRYFYDEDSGSPEDFFPFFLKTKQLAPCLEALNRFEISSARDRKSQLEHGGGFGDMVDYYLKKLEATLAESSWKPAEITKRLTVLRKKFPPLEKTEENTEL